MSQESLNPGNGSYWSHFDWFIATSVHQLVIITFVCVGFNVFYPQRWVCVRNYTGVSRRTERCLATLSCQLVEPRLKFGI